MRYLSLIACGLAALGSLSAADADAIRFVGKTKYLNDARAVVTHSIDDSTKLVATAIDTLDKYGVKTTVFVSTEADPPPEERFLTQLQIKPLWPRLQKAIDDGHEIGSHASTHPCKRPDTEAFCTEAYTDVEVTGSRDEILKHTRQPHVWTWCYPCGHCANYDFIQKKIAEAGYIIARAYPNEAQDGHIMPNLQTWDKNPMNAMYTQVVQKRGGSAKTAVLDLTVLDSKFDEIYKSGGIYAFMSHPQWLDYGPEAFFEKHLAHISKRKDVWYVPMGPLYAYKTIYDKTEVKPAEKGKFVVSNTLDRKIYNGSLTLEFQAPATAMVYAKGKALPEWKPDAVTDRWTEEYFRRDGERLLVTVHPNTTLEIRTK